MKNKGFLSGIFILSILFGLVSGLSAQDEEVLRIAGTDVTLPILEALSGEVSADDFNIAYEVMSTRAGIAALCQGDIAGVSIARPMTIEEGSLCRENGIDYIELLVGHNVVAFIANPADEFLGCLVREDLNAIFAPSAQVTVRSWSDVDEFYPQEPLAVALMADNTLTYFALDRVVDGDGLRNDAFFGSAEEVIATVADTVGMIGAVPLAIAQAYETDIVILDVDFDTQVGCTFPSVELVESRLYAGADSLYLYVNKAEVEALTPLLDTMLDIATAEVIEGTGYSAPSAFGYNVNALIVAGEEVGRTFTQDVVSFSIPANLSGSVTIVGSPLAGTFINTVVGNLTSQFEAFTVNVNTLGESDGIRRFCNGEAPIAIVNSTLDSERQALCEANDVIPVYFPLGSRAVVLIANEGDDFALCLTLDQITQIWGASSDTVENWQDVGASFPDAEMTLFGISAGDASSDLLLTRAGQATLPIRIDTQLNPDALYRAAATANVPGALTYMSWTDYQRVLSNNQANIQLVAVNGTNGCILPSEASIVDGTYALSQSAQVMVSQSALGNIGTQSLLWSMFNESSLLSLERTGLIGVDFSDLPALREALQESFAIADDIAGGDEDDNGVVEEPVAEEVTEEEADEEVIEEEADEDEE